MEKARAGLVVLDHHLAREPGFRAKVKGAFSAGAVTGAELIGLPPLTDRLASWRETGKLGSVLELAASQDFDLELLEPPSLPL